MLMASDIGCTPCLLMKEKNLCWQHAAQNYHKLYRRPRGMYFDATDKGSMVCFIWQKHSQWLPDAKGCM